MNYWLSPSGKVWCEEKIGYHYERALKIIDEKFSYILDENEMLPSSINPVEFLEEKGYIRYMDWGTPKWIIYTQRPTKSQIEKMFILTKFVYEKGNK